MQTNKYGLSFIIFGLICLFTAWVLSSHSGDVAEQNFPPSGGKFGPITVDEENEVVEIVIAQRVGNRQWSSVEGRVVDASGNYLFAFSEELWFESGYDAEGAWQEGKNHYDISVTFPKPGDYFIDVSSVNSRSSGVGDIHVKANKKVGSSIAHLWLGFLSLIIGGVIIYFSGLGGSFKKF